MAHIVRMIVRAVPMLVAALMTPLSPALAQRVDTAHEPPRTWRVCITDLSLPPYLNNDPARLGVAERMLVDAGRQVGLNVQLMRYPMRRCGALVDGDGADALLAGSTPGNQARFDFPMKAGAVDVGRRLARINLLWIARGDGGFEWDGHTLAGKAPDSVLVGTRLGMPAAYEPLQARGFKVDVTSSTITQLMQKVVARRVDLAVGLQEEVEIALRDPALAPLVMLPRPFLTSDFYAVVHKPLAPEMREIVEAWWTAIGRLREQPDYRPR